MRKNDGLPPTTRDLLTALAFVLLFEAVVALAVVALAWAINSLMVQSGF